MARTFFVVLLLNMLLMSLAHAAALGVFVERQFTTGKLFIKEITLEKPHLIPDNLLHSILSGYEGREVTVAELQALQSRLSRYYYDAGYVNSGVIVPEQNIQAGVLRLKAVHGRVQEIKLSGNQQLENDYVNGILATGLSVPLNYFELQNSLLFLRQHEMLEDLKAQLLPGEELGQSILNIELVEKTPWIFSSKFSNHLSPSIGRYRLDVQGGHRNVFGLRDSLNLQLGASEGVRDVLFDYALPVSKRDSKILLRYQYSDYAIIEEPFDQADIESETQSALAGFQWSVQRSLKYTSSVTLAVEKTHSETYMFGIPVSLAPGPVNGKSDTHSAQLVFSWRLRDKLSGLAAIFGVEKGLDVGDVTMHDDLPDGDYLLGHAQLAAMRAFGKRLHKLVFRSSLQVSEQALLPMQKFAVGGALSVRGYRENQFVRDNGASASLEMHLNVYRNRLFLIPFADYGRAWDHDVALLQGKSDEIYSAGAGLAWSPNKQVTADVFAAAQLVDLDGDGDTLQDKGVHFSLRYEY